MPHVILKDFPHCLTNKGKGTSKIPMFKHFSELEKIWYCSLGLSNIPIFHHFYELEKTWKYIQNQPRPTFQNPNFESMDELGKVLS